MPPRRFSFPAGCPVVLDDPGSYRITKLDDDSLLVEEIGGDTAEAEGGSRIETISEIGDSDHE